MRGCCTFSRITRPTVMSVHCAGPLISGLGAAWAAIARAATGSIPPCTGAMMTLHCLPLHGSNATERRLPTLHTCQCVAYRSVCRSACALRNLVAFGRIAREEVGQQAETRAVKEH